MLVFMCGVVVGMVLGVVLVILAIFAALLIPPDAHEKRQTLE